MLPAEHLLPSGRCASGDRGLSWPVILLQHPPILAPPAAECTCLKRCRSSFLSPAAKLLSCRAHSRTERRPGVETPPPQTQPPPSIAVDVHKPSLSSAAPISGHSPPPISTQSADRAHHAQPTGQVGWGIGCRYSYVQFAPASSVAVGSSNHSLLPGVCNGSPALCRGRAGCCRAFPFVPLACLVILAVGIPIW